MEVGIQSSMRLKENKIIIKFDVWNIFIIYIFFQGQA